MSGLKGDARVFSRQLNEYPGERIIGLQQRVVGDVPGAELHRLRRCFAVSEDSSFSLALSPAAVSS
jgi:hypothetical protein